MQYFVLITQVAISMIVPPFLGTIIGMYLDKWLNTDPIFALFMLICGVIAGFINTYKLIIVTTKLRKKNESK